jgi:anti-anti-sigma factor
MKNINVINSSGLGVLISCLSKIKSRDGLLKLLNLNAKIFNIFKITKLNLVFDIS